MTFLFWFLVTTALYASLEPGHRCYEWKAGLIAFNAAVFALLGCLIS